MLARDLGRVRLVRGHRVGLDPLLLAARERTDGRRRARVPGLPRMPGALLGRVRRRDRTLVDGTATTGG